MFLLDTNVWIAFLRRATSPVVPRLLSKPPDEIRVCSVVLAELLYGTLRSANPTKNRAAVDALLAPFECLPFDASAAEQFATIRRHLETQGTPIGPYDLQIAAIALANGCVLVTHNTNEFSRIPELALEDWETP